MRKSRRKQIQRKQLIFVFCGILVGVFGLTIGYAALSSTLNVSGSAGVSASSWDVSINKVDARDIASAADYCRATVDCFDNYCTCGTGVLLNDGTISSTGVSGLKVSLSKPGDYVELKYRIINNGSVPAKIKVYRDKQYTFGVNTSNSDKQWINSYFMKDSLLIYEEYSTIMGVNNILCPGKSALLFLPLKITDAAESLPSSSVEIESIGVELEFVQADSSLCE